MARLVDLLRIADASSSRGARRQALAYQAVLDVMRAQTEPGRPAKRRPRNGSTPGSRTRPRSPHDRGGPAGRAELLETLLCHEVNFVVIRGAAIQSDGRAYDTQDIDVTRDTDEANLQRLAECRLVTDPADRRSWLALPADYFRPRSLLTAFRFECCNAPRSARSELHAKRLPRRLRRPGARRYLDARRRHISLGARRVARRCARVDASRRPAEGPRILRRV